MDGIILLYVPNTDILKDRVAKRNFAALNDEEFQKRLKAQMAYQNSVDILNNSGVPFITFCNDCSLDELKERCLSIYNQLIESIEQQLPQNPLKI